MISRLRPKFTRQLPIGPYFADFACRRAKLIVELDGSQHAESERDKRRDAFLAQEGWTVLRIWNNDLDENAQGVFEAIVNGAAECLGGTHPQPLPSREGRTRLTLALSVSFPPVAAVRSTDKCGSRVGAGGNRMPLWVWVGLAVLNVYGGFRLVRCVISGVERYGPFEYPRDRNPFLFWVFLSFDTLCFLIVSALLIVAIASTI
jgi:hypothetical protein